MFSLDILSHRMSAMGDITQIDLLTRRRMPADRNGSIEDPCSGWTVEK